MTNGYRYTPGKYTIAAMAQIKEEERLRKIHERKTRNQEHRAKKQAEARDQ